MKQLTVKTVLGSLAVPTLLAMAAAGHAQAVFVPSVPADVGLGGIYSVKTYAAKGDGTTDDTQAIQFAINACEGAGGGEVYFPAGNYKVNPGTGQASCLLVNTGNVRLVGAGFASRIARAASGCDTLHIQSASTISTAMASLNHDSVEQLYFNPSVASANTDTEIVCPATSHLTLADLNFGQNPPSLVNSPAIASNCGTLMSLGNANAPESGIAWVTNIRAFGYYTFCTANNIVDMTWSKWDGDANRLVSAPIVTGTQVEAIRGTSVDLVNSAGAPATAGVSFQNMQGATWEIKGRTRFCTLTDCYFDTNQIGVLVDANAGAQSIGFHNCWFSPRPGQGIVWNTGNNGLQCIGCQFTNIGSEGIRLLGGSGHQITSNQFVNNGQVNAVPDIYIDPAVTGAIVTGNTAANALGLLPIGTSSAGLFIGPGTNGVIATGNDFSAVGGLVNGAYNSSSVVNTNNLPQVLFQDGFADTAGVDLKNHVATTINGANTAAGLTQPGETWAQTAGSGTIAISPVSDIYSNNSAGVGATYYNTFNVAQPSEFEFTLLIDSDINGSMGPMYECGTTTDTGYNLRYTSSGGSAQAIQLIKFGSSVTFLANQAIALTTGHSYQIKCFVSGTSQLAFTAYLYDLSAQGVRQQLFGGTVTDTTPLPVTGKIGIRCDGAGTATTGFHLDNLVVQP